MSKPDTREIFCRASSEELTVKIPDHFDVSFSQDTRLMGKNCRKKAFKRPREPERKPAEVACVP